MAMAYTKTSPQHKCHAVPFIGGGIEDSEGAMMVFQYCIATLEVNMFIGQKHFVWDDTEKQALWAFCHNLAWDLFLNPYHAVSLQQPQTIKCLRNNLVTHERAKRQNGIKFVTNAPHKCNQFTYRSMSVKNIKLLFGTSNKLLS